MELLGLGLLVCQFVSLLVCGQWKIFDIKVLKVSMIIVWHYKVVESGQGMTKTKLLVPKSLSQDENEDKDKEKDKTRQELGFIEEVRQSITWQLYPKSF